MPFRCTAGRRANKKNMLQLTDTISSSKVAIPRIVYFVRSTMTRSLSNLVLLLCHHALQVISRKVFRHPPSHLRKAHKAMANDATQPAGRPKANKAKRQLIGFKQRIEINEERARERAGTPDNVVSRKGFVV